jgi:hypothetical protein
MLTSVRKPVLRALAALGLALVFTSSASATTLAGSDLLKGKYTATLQKSAPATPALTLKFDGSLMSERYLRSNRAEAALLFIPDKTKIPEIVSGDWQAVPIAFQTIVVAVNWENKLERLDLPTLASLFGKKQETGELRSWDAIPKSALRLPIHTLLTRYDLSVATPMFRNRVLHDGEFRSNTSFFTSDASSIEHISASPASIGILSVPPPPGGTTSVRVLALMAKPDSPSAYLPTPDNLHNGDYPLAVPLYLVVPKANLTAVRPLFPVLFGDELADALLEAGFVPVAKNLRKNFQQRLDNVR